ncbi:nucleoside recognition domain-containing protein [Serpentinicella sp. ANB-PHB4]|uniref:nucleoside recognition domain-containing protein n=1 Tax=Serpentinicella sp. ANB-PHB4 TaxID=3074076 RepID=UPI00285DE72C|nr:nucleoside recognition domain-containing protein [Serpentinicella sp. ANB-PHB4]MDR5659212.1 nucleoside recognition domain-containing protein [Serpentinicella sp. ANB-PHB4]
MNKIWFILTLIGVIVAILTGKPEIINEVILEDSQKAVTFAISLTGIMCFWLGLMNIAQKSGLIYSLANVMKPITKRLFPEVPENHPAMSAIMMNMVANMFGAGNSATALGIKAMEDLQTINRDKRRATNAMCMFLVINMSSIQLIPLTVLKIRADAGSIDPTEIIATSILATTVSTIVGIIVCKLLEGRR